MLALFKESAVNVMNEEAGVIVPFHRCLLYTSEQCAAQMDISRSTVQEIYEVARRKIAACLVHGKPLHITGGNYRICGGQELSLIHI